MSQLSLVQVFWVVHLQGTGEAGEIEQNRFSAPLDAESHQFVEERVFSGRVYYIVASCY